MSKTLYKYAIVLLLCPLARVWPGAPDQAACQVKGTVLFDGEVPARQEWKLDEAIQRVTGDKIYRDETWLVGKSGPGSRSRPGGLLTRDFESFGPFRQGTERDLQGTSRGP
jgi:hypothetical protein